MEEEYTGQRRRHRRGKITDEDEVQQWFEEGRTYAWMAEQYSLRGITISPTAFSEYRAVRGWERRNLRDDTLIPWAVKEEHRYKNLLNQLRVEAQLRAGRKTVEDLSYPVRVRWEAFRRKLDEENVVVKYDPDTEEGFLLVPRKPSDNDIIRRPAYKSTHRRQRRSD